jgi:hypothetical protein
MEPIEFINNHLKYNSPINGPKNFKLYPFQEELVNKFHNRQNNIFCSSRQSGKTIVPLYYLLHQALFNPESNILILSNKSSISSSHIDTIQYATKGIVEPWPMNPPSRTSNTLRFHNGSTIHSDSSVNPASLTGRLYTHIFLDEFAFLHYEEANEVWNRLYYLYSDAKVIIGSTKNDGSFFNELLISSAQGYAKLFASVYDWYFVPGRDKKWKEQTINMIGSDAFDREYQMSL